MTLTIGLTGGIASGKSTVSNIFKQLNIPVIDADNLARQVVEPGQVAYDEIVHTFGSHMLNEDSTLNRKKLGELVFSDEAERHKLNEIVHPAVRKEMLKQRTMHIDSGAHAVVLDIPLLFESKLTHLVDQILVVYVDAETQLERLMKRDELSRDKAEKRIQAQMPLEYKTKHADATIDNNHSIAATQTQLLNILQKWRVQ